MRINKLLLWYGVAVLFLFSGCALFQPGRSDIRGFDRKYLKNKYAGKSGWAKEDLGGIKKGQKLVIADIEFAERTIVHLKSGTTDFFFIIYSNRELGKEKKGKDTGPVAYDIKIIEQEIEKHISFLSP